MIRRAISADLAAIERTVASAYQNYVVRPGRSGEQINDRSRPARRFARERRPRWSDWSTPYCRIAVIGS